MWCPREPFSRSPPPHSCFSLSLPCLCLAALLEPGEGICSTCTGRCSVAESSLSSREMELSHSPFHCSQAQLLRGVCWVFFLLINAIN